MRAQRQKNNKKLNSYLFEIKIYTHNVTTLKMIAANFIGEKITETRAVSFKVDNDEKAVEIHKLISGKIDSYIRDLSVDLKTHHKDALVSTT